jgi:succinate dehydrogenase/fumarate reductase flavoprotein subunit
MNRFRLNCIAWLPEQHQQSPLMQILTTDVAIIGGGAAGCYAALNLQKLKIKPLIICKGLVGKSGASLFAGNLVISGRLLGNSEAQARNTAEFLIKYHNQFLIDQNWARRCGAWIEQVYYPELEELGLYFRRDDAGNVVTSPGAIRSVAANVQGNSGVPFMDLRRKQIIRAGIPQLEETAATALLRNDDGSIGGVFCLNYMTGEYVAVQARAVVLATGYSDRLHQRSTGTREMSADGIAMAWRAGATLVNMEMQWWHTNDIADPPCWQRMQVYPNPMLGSEKSARMVNSVGEEFFNQQTIRLRLVPTPCSSKPWPNKCTPGKRATMAAIMPVLIIAMLPRSKPIRPTARPSASLDSSFPTNWSKPPSHRTIGKAVLMSIPQQCGRQFRGFMSPAGSVDTATA